MPQIRRKKKSDGVPAKVVEMPKKPGPPMLVCDNCGCVLGEKIEWPKRPECPQCQWTVVNE